MFKSLAFMAIMVAYSFSPAFAFLRCNEIPAKISAEEIVQTPLPEFKPGKILSAVEERAIGEAMIAEEKKILMQILDSSFALDVLTTLQDKLKKDPRLIRHIIKMKIKGKVGEPLTDEQMILVRQTQKNLKYLIETLHAYHLAKGGLQKAEQARQLKHIQTEFFKMDWARMFYNRHLIQASGVTNSGWQELQTLFLNFNNGLVYSQISENSAASDKRFDLEELYQVGREGMRTAVLYYEPSYGFKFSTQAKRWIKQKLDRFIKIEKEDEMTSIDKTAQNESEENANPLTSFISQNREQAPDERASYFDEQSLRASPIEDLLSKIPENEANILRLHFGIGVQAVEWEEMGRILNKDPGAVRAKSNLAMKRLQAFLLINSGELSYKESYILAQKYLHFPARREPEIAKDLKLPKANIKILEDAAFEKWEIKKGPLLRALFHR